MLNILKISNFCSFFVLLALISSMFFLSEKANANPPEAVNFFGVDTIIVTVEILPEHTLVPQISIHPIFSSVKTMFADVPWVSVKMPDEVPVKEWKNSNVLFLSYGISAQPDLIDGKTVNVASLVLQITKHGDHGPKSLVPQFAVSYPFIISDDTATFNKKVLEGIVHLTSYLPSHFICAYWGYPSEQCPHCSLKCAPRYPVKEKLRPPCPAPVKGQTMPIPCSAPVE